MKVRVTKFAQIGEHGWRHAGEEFDVTYAEYLARHALGQVESVGDPAEALTSEIKARLDTPVREPEELRQALKDVGRKIWNTL